MIKYIIYNDKNKKLEMNIEKIIHLIKKDSNKKLNY